MSDGNGIKDYEWSRRIGKSEKGTSDYLNTAVSWTIIFAAIAIAVEVALIVLISLI